MDAVAFHLALRLYPCRVQHRRNRPVRPSGPFSDSICFVIEIACGDVMDEDVMGGRGSGEGRYFEGIG